MADSIAEKKLMLSRMSGGAITPPVLPFPRLPEILRGKNPEYRKAWDEYEKAMDDWRKKLFTAGFSASAVVSGGTMTTGGGGTTVPPPVTPPPPTQPTIAQLQLQIAALQALLALYLPLAGGTETGNVTMTQGTKLLFPPGGGLSYNTTGGISGTGALRVNDGGPNRGDLEARSLLLSNSAKLTAIIMKDRDSSNFYKIELIVVDGVPTITINDTPEAPSGDAEILQLEYLIIKDRDSSDFYKAQLILVDGVPTLLLNDTPEP